MQQQKQTYVIFVDHCEHTVENNIDLITVNNIEITAAQDFLQYFRIK